MTQNLLLCLGSNTRQQYHIDTAQRLLTEALGPMRFTPPLWTKPMGIESPQFINCLGTVETTLDYDQILRLTKDIERKMGRTHGQTPSHTVLIDIDIMRLGDKIYHAADWERDFVKVLLKDL